MESLKSSYSFQGQLKYLNHLCQTNVFLAENVNSILPNVPRTVLAQITEELKL